MSQLEDGAGREFCFGLTVRRAHAPCPDGPSYKFDGSHPPLLDGYGAYSITIDPEFDPRYLTWIEQGGVLAFAHVRGGGEYGEEWHESGMLQNKANTWRDFIVCAEYLIKQGYTYSAKLAGQGGSAGGILIGRAFTERPELFAAAISDADLRRYGRILGDLS